MVKDLLRLSGPYHPALHVNMTWMFCTWIATKSVPNVSELSCTLIGLIIPSCNDGTLGHRIISAFRVISLNKKKSPSSHMEKPLLRVLVSRLC